MYRPSKRLSYIDRGKALAIMSVVFGHVCLFCFYDLGVDISHLRIMHFTNIFQMPLFIFLIGLVVSFRPIKIQGVAFDLKKRFRTLIVPFGVIGGMYTFFLLSVTERTIALLII